MGRRRKKTTKKRQAAYMDTSVGNGGHQMRIQTYKKGSSCVKHVPNKKLKNKQGCIFDYFQILSLTDDSGCSTNVHSQEQKNKIFQSHKI